MFYEHLHEKGFIIGNRNGFFQIDPPLIMTEEEFLSFISAFREILESLPR